MKPTVKNDNYNAIIDVTYDYDNVEYHRQYELFYKKNTRNGFLLIQVITTRILGR